MNGCAGVAIDKIHTLTILGHQDTSAIESGCHLAPNWSATKKMYARTIKKKRVYIYIYEHGYLQTKRWFPEIVVSVYIRVYAGDSLFKHPENLCLIES